MLYVRSAYNYVYNIYAYIRVGILYYISGEQILFVVYRYNRVGYTVLIHRMSIYF